ncbi:hypothetical protein [Acetobacter estunensis]|uniref:hypothetical protein n=1 Tax=Acetobacter estunensis TaxID=104097 RepID=UPI001C2DD338|nr:hypothetical protein [Acetobacter estunensis]MBV1836160.1 hypothetical protein [Acetobacter estunensis]
MPELESIPSVAHFVTTGRKISWAQAFAIASATRHGMKKVIVHHAGSLEDSPQCVFLLGQSTVSICRLDVGDTLRRVGRALEIPGFAELYRLTTDPVIRDSILRAALLYRFGGISLSFDSMMIGELHLSSSCQTFFGCERIASHTPIANFLSRVKDGVSFSSRRKSSSPVPAARPAFTGTVPSTAVFGAVQHAPFLATWLRGLIAHDGTGKDSPSCLLSSLLALNTFPDVEICPPQMICAFDTGDVRRLFRAVRGERLRTMRPSASVVHWRPCAFTRECEAGITPDHVMENAYRQLYSNLIWEHVPAVQDIVYLRLA